MAAASSGRPCCCLPGALYVWQVLLFQLCPSFVVAIVVGFRDCAGVLVLLPDEVEGLQLELELGILASEGCPALRFICSIVIIDVILI